MPVTNLVGKEGQGFSIAMNGLNGGRVNIGMCLVDLGLGIRLHSNEEMFGN